MGLKSFLRLSESPTNPTAAPGKPVFDVADLYKGPIAEVAATAGAGLPLDEKLRKAYFWVTNNAIISPFYDVEYHDAGKAALSYAFGDQKSRVVLPSGQSYSSFVLMPLLTLVLRKKCLLVGGPGRGKTASAILMGVLAGYPMKEIRRAIQHGQPQMTISDLLGNPLPGTLVNAKSMDEIQIAWRRWLSMRIKIIDEYNRIPTRTQSALLTVMADNYAEILDQVFDCPESAWYLTANDEAGGGTYQVIEALRDRIDVVVQAFHFNSRFLAQLLTRIEEGFKPEDVVPLEIIFTEEEIDRIHAAVLQVAVPTAVRRRIEFFAGQFELLEMAAEQIEYKTKDTVKLVGADLHQVASRDTGKDKSKDLGSQTLNGLSVRALMTLLSYAKGLAYFRGNREVSFEDVRQVVPFVLYDKLVQNADSPYFEAGGNSVLRTDRVSWIRRLFDLSCAEYDRLDLDREDPVRDFSDQFAVGLEGLSESEAKARQTKIERTLSEWSKGRKLYGPLYDDILTLKYLHQRYTNYLTWLRWKG